LYLRIKCVDNLHPVFKYMRATASQHRAHASQNKTDTHKYRRMKCVHLTRNRALP
jgi:hypothetical protein